MGRGETVPRFARPPAAPQELSEHLSVSQVETLADCGMKYRLQRVDGIQEVPAWWNIGGTAFHATIEWWERQLFATAVRPGTGQAIEVFRQLFSAERLRTDAATRIPRTQWHAGGSGKEDGAWWQENGPLMVTAYVAAASTDPSRVMPLAPDAPAIELEFTLDVNGIPVKGYIDQVRYALDPSATAVYVVDLKAGRNKPSGTFQLGVYGQAVRRVFGLPASVPLFGQYWLARKGEYTAPVNLDRDWPWEAIVYRVHMAERIRRAGLYQPRESSFCGSCAVRDECPTRTGRWPSI